MPLPSVAASCVQRLLRIECSRSSASHVPGACIQLSRARLPDRSRDRTHPRRVVNTRVNRMARAGSFFAPRRSVQ